MEQTLDSFFSEPDTANETLLSWMKLGVPVAYTSFLNLSGDFCGML